MLDMIDEKTSVEQTNTTDNTVQNDNIVFDANRKGISIEDSLTISEFTLIVGFCASYNRDF